MTHLLLAASWDTSGGRGGAVGRHGEPGKGGPGGTGGEAHVWYALYPISRPAGARFSPVSSPTRNMSH